MNYARPAVFPRLPNKPLRDLPRANVLGVGIHAIDLSLAVEIVRDSLCHGRRGYVCVTGVHGVMEALRDRSFRDVLARALLVTPDGMPTVWLGRLQGQRQMKRVFGPDLMNEICRTSIKHGFKHFLYGGKPGVAQELRDTMRKKFPGIRVVGSYTPPFRPLSRAETDDFYNIVRCSRPDIIWVGLSTPRQELFMAEHLENLECKLMIGVGAAFDIHTGHLRDAPNWVKRAGLQWIHRLGQEPSRLWKRYLVNNSAFLWNVTGQLTGLKRFDVD